MFLHPLLPSFHPRSCLHLPLTHCCFIPKIKYPFFPHNNILHCCTLIIASLFLDCHSTVLCHWPLHWICSRFPHVRIIYVLKNMPRYNQVGLSKPSQNISMVLRVLNMCSECSYIEILLINQKCPVSLANPTAYCIAINEPLLGINSFCKLHVTQCLNESLAQAHNIAMHMAVFQI